MRNAPPKTVTLCPDEYSAEHAGVLKDGRQFFLTTPFVPGHGSTMPGCEFIALYIFDKSGNLKSATIDDLGPRPTMDEVARIARRDQLLESLGKWKPRRIRIRPFRVEMFGVEFGFIARPPEEPDEDWRVTVEPGDYMCFWPPWSSGDYDT